MTVESNHTLRFVSLVIGLKISRQYFNQREEKPNPIAAYKHDIYHPLSKLQVIGRNSDWCISLFALVLIGRSDYFGIGFSTVI